MSPSLASAAAGPSFLDPEWLISTFGLIGILAIVFAESGLLIGFFLPGDSLLFTAGLLVADGHYLHQRSGCSACWWPSPRSPATRSATCSAAKVGPALFRRPDSRLFKQENVAKAHDFFDSTEPVRSCWPGSCRSCGRSPRSSPASSRMHYRTFLIYNVIGGTLWGVGVTVLGYFLGQIAFVKANIEIILISIVVVSVLPIGIQLLRSRRAATRNPAAATNPGASAPPQTPTPRNK